MEVIRLASFAAVLAWFTLKLAKELPFTALLRQMRGRDPEPPQ